MQTDSGRQSGNVIAFIIVGIALAALLAGGIYASKQQGRVASQTDTVAVNTDDSQKEQQSEDQKSSDASSNAQPAQNTQQPSQPSQDSTPAAPANNTDNSGSGGSSQAQVPHTGPSSIASTGPEDGILPAATFGLLTIGVISYVRSQRSFRTSALK